MKTFFLRIKQWLWTIPTLILFALEKIGAIETWDGIKQGMGRRRHVIDMDRRFAKRQQTPEDMQEVIAELQRQVAEAEAELERRRAKD